MDSNKPSNSKNDLKPVALQGKEFRRIVPKDELSAETREVPGRKKKSVTPSRPVATPQEEKRRQLADLLWGQPEFQTHAPTEAGVSARAEIPEEEASARRVSQRRECNFPGLLKVLLPEQTFSPRAFAIRLVDISPHGARIVTRQLSDALVKSIGEDKRFARLEVMIPAQEKLVIAGRIAWLRFDPDLSQIGFQFEKEFPQAGELFSNNLNSASSSCHPAFAIAAPKIDPFPAITGHREFRFSGSAPGAESILVRNGIDERTTPVADGRFDVDVVLAADRSNFLSFTTLCKGTRSIPTPVCLVHRTGASDSVSVPFTAPMGRITVEHASQTLSLKISGTPLQIRNALQEVEKVLPHAQRLTMSIEIEGDVEAAAAKLKKLAE